MTIELLPAKPVAPAISPVFAPAGTTRRNAYVNVDAVKEFKLSEEQRRALEELAEWREASKKSGIIIGKPTYIVGKPTSSEHR